MRKCTEESFYRDWMTFLAPFHRLTNRGMDVAARILQQYFRLKEEISDPEVLREVLWSPRSRQDMMQSLGMTPAHFQMTLAKLKKAGVLLNGDIHPKYIPHKGDNPSFTLLVAFDWSTRKNPVRDAGK